MLSRFQPSDRCDDVRPGPSLHETQCRKRCVFAIQLDAQPFPAELLGNPSGRVRARENIDHAVTWLGEKLDEELWQGGWKSGRVAIPSDQLAHPQVVRIAF